MEIHFIVNNVEGVKRWECNAILKKIILIVSGTLFLVSGCSFFSTTSEKNKSEMIEVTWVKNDELDEVAAELKIPW